MLFAAQSDHVETAVVITAGDIAGQFGFGSLSEVEFKLLSARKTPEVNDRPRAVDPLVGGIGSAERWQRGAIESGLSGEFLIQGDAGPVG